VCLVPTHHAPSIFLVRPGQNHVNCLMDGLNIGLSHHPATHHRRMALTAYALELGLQRGDGRHGRWIRHVHSFVVSDMLNVTRLASELSVGPVGQVIRPQADQRAICAGNNAFQSSRMSSDFCKLILPENKFYRSNINVFAVHIPRSLGACGAFFGPVMVVAPKAGQSQTGGSTFGPIKRTKAPLGQSWTLHFFAQRPYIISTVIITGTDLSE